MPFISITPPVATGPIFSGGFNLSSITNSTVGQPLQVWLNTRPLHKLCYLDWLLSTNEINLVPLELVWKRAIQAHLSQFPNDIIVGYGSAGQAGVSPNIEYIPFYSSGAPTRDEATGTLADYFNWKTVDRATLEANAFTLQYWHKDQAIAKDAQSYFGIRGPSGDPSFDYLKALAPNNFGDRDKVPDPESPVLLPNGKTILNLAVVNFARRNVRGNLDLAEKYLSDNWNRGGSWVDDIAGYVIAGLILTGAVAVIAAPAAAGSGAGAAGAGEATVDAAAVTTGETATAAGGSVLTSATGAVTTAATSAVAGIPSSVAAVLTGAATTALKNALTPQAPAPVKPQAPRLSVIPGGKAAPQDTGWLPLLAAALLFL